MKEDKKTELTDEVTQSDPEQLGEGVPGDSNSKQLPPNVEELKSRKWLPYLITFAVLIAVTLLVAWARGGYTQTDSKKLLSAWCDALFVPGILCVCFGLLVLASNGGAFDMLTYGVIRLFALFKKDPVDRKYGGYYEYQQARRSKKRSFWYLVIVGSVFVAVSIILFVIYRI